MGEKTKGTEKKRVKMKNMPVVWMTMCTLVLDLIPNDRELIK